MPIYEYRCQKCASEYEKREGFDASARQKCPKCGGKALRVFHPAPILFKGSGFYVTDNRKSPTDTEKKPSETSGESTGDASGDSADKDTEPAAAS